MEQFDQYVGGCEMARIFDLIMADGRQEALFGEGPERALSALGRISPQHGRSCALFEIPLLGEASYDLLVGLYSKNLSPGDRVGDKGLTTVQAVVDWATAWEGERALNLFFELDAAGAGEGLSGFHCRHYQQLEAADAFFDVLGEGWRVPIYRSAAARLPDGWIADFAAAFPGRPESLTRLEIVLGAKARQSAKGDPDYVRGCFDSIGFSAYDDAMLDSIAGFVGICPANTLQFDIQADGSLGETFSLVSYFEGLGADFHGLFGEEGRAHQVLTAYQGMGVADDRWHQVEGALFAREQLRMAHGRFERVARLSLPCCAKVKWRSAKPVMSKLYLITSATTIK